METIDKIGIKRKDGVFVNVRFEPVKGIRTAVKFNDIEEFNEFMNGYYKPVNPEMYKAQRIRVSYEEVNEHV